MISPLVVVVWSHLAGVPRRQPWDPLLRRCYDVVASSDCTKDRFSCYRVWSFLFFTMIGEESAIFAPLCGLPSLTDSLSMSLDTCSLAIIVHPLHGYKLLYCLCHWCMVTGATNFCPSKWVLKLVASKKASINDLSTQHVPSRLQFTDAFTNGLPLDPFQDITCNIVIDIHSPPWG